MSELAGSIIAGLALALMCAFVVWYIRNNPPKE